MGLGVVFFEGGAGVGEFLDEVGEDAVFAIVGGEFPGAMGVGEPAAGGVAGVVAIRTSVTALRSLLCKSARRRLLAMALRVSIVVVELLTTALSTCVASLL